MLSATVGSLADVIPGEGDLPVDGGCHAETFPIFAWEESGFGDIASTSSEEGLDEVSGSELELSGAVEEFFVLHCIGHLPATEWTQETDFTGEWMRDEVAPLDTDLPSVASGEGDSEPFIIRCFGADPFVSHGDQDDVSMREGVAFEASSSGASGAITPPIESGAPAVQQRGDFNAAAAWFGSFSGVDTDGPRLPGGKRRTR